MKKWMILLLALLLCMGCAHAQTTALPMDARIYIEREMADGSVTLEGLERTIPAGTLCTVEEVAETDESCSLTSMARPFHRFARVSYHDAQGEAREDWVMLYSVNLAVTQKLETPDQVQAYARRFFSNQYVMAANEETSISHDPAGDGWRVELKDEQGNVTHYAIFDSMGRVAQYRDLSFEVPDVSGGACYQEELSNAANETGAMPALEWISKELFPDAGFNSVPCQFYDEETDVYTFFVDSFDYYVCVQAGEQPRLMAYGDFRQEDGGYPGYLTRAEALEKALQTIQQDFALDENAAVDAVFASFSIAEPEWLQAGDCAAQWEITLRLFANDIMSEFWISLDAQTGEVIPAEIEMGNG